MAVALPFNLDEDRVINVGQDGTIIYRGRLGQRHIAVKKMPLRKMNLARNEIDVLQRSDAHENVIRYFDYETDNNFIYLALELASGSLYDYVPCRRCREALPPVDVCLQITSGLRHLHSLPVVHRNIKPSNILFVTLPHQRLVVKISDYAITKTLEQDTESFYSSITIDSVTYAAPELQVAGERYTYKLDIYSLGKVFFFVLTNGNHLDRGPPYDLRDIRNGTQRILIEAMVSTRPEDRPAADEIIAHPAFWSPERSMHFIQELSNRAPETFDFERYREEAFQGDWTNLLDPLLMSQVSKFRGYDGDSFRQLIRLVRNLSNHPPPKKRGRRIIGSTDKSLLDYFNSRIPNFMYYAWLTGRPLGEGVLRGYYE